MKFVIAFLLVVLSFCNGKTVPLDATEVFSNNVNDPPPPASNVTVNVTWTFNSGVGITNVVINANNLKASQYAAVGLSQNQSMGESHVFICKRFANDEIVVQRFINPEAHQHPKPAGSEQGGVFTPLPSKFQDGVVTCQFNLSNFASPSVNPPNTLRPLSPSAQYYPIFAVGVVNATGDVQYHDGRQPQPGLVQLNQNQYLFYLENNTSIQNDIYPSL